MTKYVKCNEDLLAVAVVLQAMRDYWKVCLPDKRVADTMPWRYSRYEKYSDVSTYLETVEKKRLTEKKTLEKFFRSDWGRTLCGSLDPEFLMDYVIKKREKGEKISGSIYINKILGLEEDERSSKRLSA